MITYKTSGYCVKNAEQRLFVSMRNARIKPRNNMVKVMFLRASESFALSLARWTHENMDVLLIIGGDLHFSTTYATGDKYT